MKEELTGLKDKVKILNKKMKTSNLSKTNGVLSNQNCDFEICMEEDCVEPEK